jgi:hypothetical protein
MFFRNSGIQKRCVITYKATTEIITAVKATDIKIQIKE